MPRYSIRINSSTGTYHIFNSVNANNDRDVSFCGTMDYEDTEEVEGSSNLDRGGIEEEISMVQSTPFCRSCINVFNA